ncbi:hypothetical protein GDO86_013078 [Hymenochirus boettgeri]|uniref:Uncharacterized protein n=1 Tax=Hymenochirus boettgeri TaxID=247094 RepID=A0A8T2ITE4_9PIPI|nr:hypothetical protein GDO86_013078 [Hymenochirus boettgeri]
MCANQCYLLCLFNILILNLFVDPEFSNVLWWQKRYVWLCKNASTAKGLQKDIFCLSLKPTSLLCVPALTFCALLLVFSLISLFSCTAVNDTPNFFYYFVSSFYHQSCILYFFI